MTNRTLSDRDFFEPCNIPTRTGQTVAEIKRLQRYEKIMHQISRFVEAEALVSSYDYESPSEYTTWQALDFVNNLPRNKSYPDKVIADSEGGIIFGWNIMNRRVVITLFEDEIHYSSEKKGEKAIYDEDSYEGGEIPADVLYKIPLEVV